MQFEVPFAWAGKRLDAFLLNCCPHCSLRARRRMITRGLVCVNGKTGSSGMHLNVHDTVSVEETGEKDAAEDTSVSGRLLDRQGDFFFFYKPACLHTMALAGGAGRSLEADLATLLRENRPENGSVSLVQRLDFATSGIVLGVAGIRAKTLFRQNERMGRVRKRYVALLEGEVPSRTVRQKLVTNDRRRTKIKAVEDSDPLRATTFVPFMLIREKDPVPSWLAFPCERAPVTMTLTGCEIFLGARHQIRAHAKALGHPLAFDVQYGAASFQNVPCTTRNLLPEAACFYLHHASLCMPDNSCILAPPWIAQDAFVKSEMLYPLWNWLRDVPNTAAYSDVHVCTLADCSMG